MGDIMDYLNTVGYDFDGVLCETMPAFHQYWYEKYGWRILDGETRTFDMPMPPDYDFKNIYSDIVEALNLYQPYLRPHAYAMEMVREMARQSNETPIIITARSLKNKEVTENWLKDYLGIPFTLVMDTKSKAETIAEWRIKYFVEDRFKTVNTLNMCEKVFMPDRSWNSGRVPQDFVVRVNNLIEVWDEIMKDE
jgi:uncharacterized HAD superfamily protein